MDRFTDLTGRRFGKLTVLNRVAQEPNGRIKNVWNCLCECGQEKIIAGSSLTKKKPTHTCGKCLQSKDLAGMKFGKLQVLNRYIGTEKKGWYWDCLCDCGTLSAKDGYRLLSGKTKSCGCISRDRKIKKQQKRLYHIWLTMEESCHTLNSIDYINYGARGLRVCNDWSNNFLSFYQWATANGYTEKSTLDLMNLDGCYEPSNCRWVTNKQQGIATRNNCHITINGQTKTITEWAELAGINPRLLRYRVVKGWKDENLLDPVTVQKVIKNGICEEELFIKKQLEIE
ncbi:MAG: hypothetical protein AB2421_08220 [Thermotaleaceae bacterium]